MPTAINISDTHLLFAFNNNIVEFTTLTNSIKCDITVDGVAFPIYPIQNKYYFNFKEIITTIINRDNYKDDANLVGSTIINATDKVYLETVILFKIFFANNTIENVTKTLSWMSGFIQLKDWREQYLILTSKNKPFILMPFKKATNKKTYAKMWKGYPFDISVYVGTSTNLKVKNNTNLIETDFINPHIVSRVVFSDGDTDTSTTTDLPLYKGINQLEFISNNANYYLELEQVEECDGIYLKWINNSGGWSYWLFFKGQNTIATKDLGELYNDFENIEDTISPTLNIGFSAKETIALTTDLINENEKTVLQDLFKNPKVYLFTGQRNAKNFYNDWIEVQLKAGTFIMSKPKSNNIKIDFSIDLPSEITRTL